MVDDLAGDADSAEEEDSAGDADPADREDSAGADSAGGPAQQVRVPQQGRLQLSLRCWISKDRFQ